MRTFIAIELPEETRDLLAKIQSELKAQGADVKWVEPQNIHLTLKFLGEVKEEKLEKVILTLESIAKENIAFSLRISSLGAFPKLDYPRVIWAGIEKGEKEAKQIAKGLEEKLQKLDIPKEERAFSAHITLGRTRSTQGREKLIPVLKRLADKLPNENLSPLEFLVTRITLFKSTLTPKGPLYEFLKEASLKTS